MNVKYFLSLSGAKRPYTHVRTCIPTEIVIKNTLIGEKRLLIVCNEITWFDRVFLIKLLRCYDIISDKQNESFAKINNAIQLNTPEFQNPAMTIIFMALFSLLLYPINLLG